MASSSRTVSLVLAVGAVAGLLVLGGLSIGLAQTLTFLALASTVVIFYLMIHISMN